MEKRHRLWRGILFCIGVFILFQIFTVAIFLVYNTSTNELLINLLEDAFIPTILMHIVCLIIPSLLYIKLFISKEEVKSRLRLNKFTFKNLSYAVLILIFTTPISMAISYMSSLYFDNISEEILALSLDYPYFLSILVLAIMPSITEELVFRGILISECDDRHDIIYAIINGILFGTMHGNFSQFFNAFYFGIIFYFIVKVTNSFFLGVILHFLVNGSQVTLMYYVLDALNENTITTETTASRTELAFIGVLVTIATILLYITIKSFFRYNNYSLVKAKNDIY